MRKNRLKQVYQSDERECGLACLCMIGNWFGINVDMWQLRQKTGAVARGMNLKSLLANAELLGLRGVPLKGEPDTVKSRLKPCILHWNFDHFVVFNRFRNGCFEIFDPAHGIRRIAPYEFSCCFTGVFVEFELNAQFVASEKKAVPRVSDYLRQTHGIFSSLGTILGVAVVLEICVLFVPLYLQFTIDHIVSQEYFDMLENITIGFIALAGVQAALSFMRSWLIVILTQHLALQWPINIFSHMMRLPMAFFYRHSLGDITSRFGSLGAIQQRLTVGASEAFLDGLMATASICVMLFYSAALTMLPVTAFLLQLMLRSLTFKKLENLSKDRLVASSKENSYFLESIRAVLPLKLFSRELERRVGWQQLMTKVQQLDIEKGRLDTLVVSVVNLISYLENIAVIYFGFRLVFVNDQGSSFTLGMLVVFLTYKVQFIARSNGILRFLFDFKMIRHHTDRLAEIVMLEAEPIASSDDLSWLTSTLELRNVSFRYESNSPWILRHVNFTCNAGERVSITGKSGEGKTTLLKIVLGLLRPTEGTIYFGGVPADELGINNIRPLIGTVMQDDALLVGSIKQNICFFDHEASDEEIARCAQLASIHEDIMQMPMGYLTKVGDLGDGLSGGQKQRVLLARAIFKKPKFLLLDEATSHLDNQNEDFVNTAISKLAITRIVVAHRHSTIQGSDKIFEVSSGHVREVEQSLATAA